MSAALGAVVFLFALPSGAALAQTLNTPTPSNNGQAGLFFDVQAANAITVTNITSAVNGVGTFQLWGRSGSFVGNANSSGGWTLLGTTTHSGSGPGTVSFMISQPLAASQSFAFYIIGTTGGSVQYQNAATAVGTLWASDSNLTIRVGTFSSGLFTGVSTATRGLVGSITYAPPVYEVPTLSEWAMILLALSLAGVGVVMVRRRAGTGMMP